MKTALILFILIMILTVSVFIFTCRQIRFMLSRPDRGELPKNMDFSNENKTALETAVKEGREYLNTLEKEDLWTYSFDHLKLHSYYYPAEEKSMKFVIGIHGFKSDPIRTFGPFARFYHNHGYNLLLADNRGHGKSQGEYLGSAVTDRFDCITWAEYITEHFGNNAEILLHGVSMGGATVLSAAGEEHLPETVKGIISDCGFTSMYEQVRRHIKGNLHLPSFPALQFSAAACYIYAGYSLTKVTPLKQIQKASVPVLFVHGGKDRLVPPEMAETLYHYCSSEKKDLFIVPDAGHAESIILDKEGYLEKIREFFM